MDRHRVDHWLKLVCLFKQRGEAAEACRGGHVKVNGQRVKPSTPLREGDVVEFMRGEWARRVVVVVLPEGQLSKENARTAYLDESPPPPVREPAVRPMFRESGAGRPTKKERREIDRVRRR
ncbi:MAG TPA: S4 domain-containing protein [Thermoanaerobaculia bacterium]|nr:S4 domain-containing protein [Thermoanaerobaculia bacterium]